MHGDKGALEYSFVIPIYNDAYLANDFCEEFSRVFREYLGTDAIESRAEVIFVNDGSADDSYVRLRDEICARYKFAKVIDLSRNFGQHIAISCGYKYARGRYVAASNVDMEDPPGQFPLLLDVVRTGEYDFVGGRYRSRGVSWLNRTTSLLFSRLLNTLTGYEVPLDMAMLRVMDRSFIDAYNQLVERSRYLPGLESWLGFRKTWVLIEHRPRTRGRSSFNLRRRFAFAIGAILSFSDLPLRITVVAGGLITLIGTVMSLALIASRIFLGDVQLGFTTTVSAIVFMGGAQMIVIGVASLYVGHILREVQGRPLFVVRDTHGF